MSIQVVSGESVLLDKEVGALLGVTTSRDPGTGAVTYLVKNTVKDEAETDILAKFKYTSGNGKMTLSLSGLDFSALPAGEVHLGLSVRVKGKIYFTSVTFFETKPGSWTTKAAR